MKKNWQHKLGILFINIQYFVNQYLTNSSSLILTQCLLLQKHGWVLSSKAGIFLVLCQKKITKIIAHPFNKSRLHENFLLNFTSTIFCNSSVSQFLLNILLCLVEFNFYTTTVETKSFYV